MTKKMRINERTRKLLAELDCEIARLQSTIKFIDPNTEQYRNISNELDKAINMKKTLNEIEKNETKKNKIELDPNTVFHAAAMLIVTLLVLKYEKTEVITSKAFSFVSKLIGHV